MTERSRPILGLPVVAVQALALRETEADEQLAAGEGWQDTGLVFTTHRAALDAGNVGKGRGWLDAARAADLIRQPAEPVLCQNSHMASPELFSPARQPALRYSLIRS